MSSWKGIILLSVGAIVLPLGYVWIDDATMVIDRTQQEKRVLMDIQKTRYKSKAKFTYEYDHTYTFFIEGTSNGYEVHNLSYGDKECQITPQNRNLIQSYIGKPISVTVEYYHSWFSSGQQKISQLHIGTVPLTVCTKEIPVTISTGATIVSK